MQEVFRWIKDALRSSLADLKPATVQVVSGFDSVDSPPQVKDLDAAFAEVANDTPKPERVLRSKMAQSDEGGAAGEGSAAVPDEPAFDPLDCVEAVDVLAKLPKDWFETVGAATKYVPNPRNYTESASGGRKRKKRLTKLLPLLRYKLNLMKLKN